MCFALCYITTGHGRIDCARQKWGTTSRSLLQAGRHRDHRQEAYRRCRQQRFLNAGQALEDQLTSRSCQAPTPPILLTLSLVTPKSSSAAARLAVRHLSINATRSSSFEDVTSVCACVSICISLRSCIISRAIEGLETVFLDASREGVEGAECDRGFFETFDVEGRGVDATVAECGVLMAGSLPLLAEAVDVSLMVAAFNVSLVGPSISGGSEDGGSSPMPGFNGVRKGDLNGLWSVLVASFSRRRFACGVDIFAIE